MRQYACQHCAEYFPCITHVVVTSVKSLENAVMHSLMMGTHSERSIFRQFIIKLVIHCTYTDTLSLHLRACGPLLWKHHGVCDCMDKYKGSRSTFTCRPRRTAANILANISSDIFQYVHIYFYFRYLNLCNNFEKKMS